LNSGQIQKIVPVPGSLAILIWQLVFDRNKTELLTDIIGRKADKTLPDTIGAELFCRHLSLQTKLASSHTLLQEEQTKICLIALGELFCRLNWLPRRHC